MQTDLEPISDTTSMTSKVHQALQTSILSGRFVPGEPLRLSALAREFQVSMTVIREALFRLAEQRLVTMAVNQGFRVAEVSRKDLMDLTDVRLEIEVAALRRSVERGDVMWQSRVVAAHHVLANSEIGSPAWSTAHQAFHDSLCDACDNPRMISITRNLRNSAEVYRQLYGWHANESKRDLESEHRLLMETVLNRDAEIAGKLLREHLEKTRDALLETGIVGNPVPKGERQESQLRFQQGERSVADENNV
jgi:DNA-binding GntR family transcriptional regulator